MCDVAVLNPTIDMTAPVTLTDGFYSSQNWSNSPPELSPHYGASPIASPPCAQSPPSSLQQSPVMPVVHSPPMGTGSPIVQQVPPIVASVKREGEFSCAAESSLSALLSAKTAPPELVPATSVFNAAEGMTVSHLFCL